MNMVLLQDVAEVFNGKTPSKAEQREAGFPVLKIKDVDEAGFFRGTFQSFVDQELAQSFEKKITQEGDILLLNAAHNSEYVGSKSAFVTGGMIGALATGEWTMVRADVKKVIPKFLYFCFSSPDIKYGIRNIVKGIHLYPKDLKRLHFPIPSLEEQKRIVSTLDQADALRRKRKEAMRLLDEYMQAVFLQMFSDNHKDWKALEEVTTFIDYRGKTPEKTEKGVRLITAKNVKEGYLKEEPKEYIADDNYIPWMRRGFPKMGDILFTTEAPLGNVAMLPHFEKVAFAQRIIIIQPSEYLTSEFLLFALSSQEVCKDILQRSTGSTVKGIRSKELKKVKVPIPPLDKQQEFSLILQSKMALKSKMIEQERYMKNQFDALMQKAFAGAI